VARRLKSIDVIDVLSDLFILRGVPEQLLYCLGEEFRAVFGTDVGSVRSEQRPPTSRRAAPWENGFVESFNARLRDELLNGEIFYTPHWRRHYNAVRPHASRSATALQPRRCSSQPSPHGRLRNPDQLRRPCSRWCHGQP
jgi:hypothetical protein